MSAANVARRGRPRAEESPVELEEILEAAFRAFATHGYDGVSVRMLNRELGVSHNLIHQRFGSKEGLWYAAVDHAFGQQRVELSFAFDPTETDPLAQLNLAIRGFLRYSADHPELLGLMNIEGRVAGPRLDYIFDRFVEPGMAPLNRLLEFLAAEGRIRPISLRSLQMLVAHGGCAPFTLVALARRFDDRDPRDPDQVEAHAALVADLITEGLRLDPQQSARGT
jgi:AcrR family transcriptional regulator